MLARLPNEAYNTVYDTVYVNSELPFEPQFKRKPELVIVRCIFYNDKEGCIRRIEDAFRIFIFPAKDQS